MIQGMSTNNKGFLDFCKLMASHNFFDLDAITKTFDPAIIGKSPYSKMSEQMRFKILAEAATNPWYVLREILREEVGISKRHIKLSVGEYLALANSLGGARTIVTAPHSTCKTNLLVVAALMLQPKAIVVSTPDSLVFYQNKFIQAMDKYINIMPDYLYQYFRGYRPAFISFNKVLKDTKKQGDFVVKGFQNKDVLMISDDFEYDDEMTANKIKIMEGYRKSTNVPWLMTSGVNENAKPNIRSLISEIEWARPDNICSVSWIGNSVKSLQRIAGDYTDKVVRLNLKDIPRYKSTAAQLRYYKNIIKGTNNEHLTYCR